MAKGIDCIEIPSLDIFKEEKITFVCRYLSEVNAATKVKILTPAEAKLLSDAGISIVSNYEWTGTTALGGFAAGVADAQIADAQHKACGGPPDRPIYFSVDFNTTATATIIAYFKGVASIIGIARVGAYGGYQDIKGLFDAGMIRWGWQTYAWSNGQWDQHAQIRQVQNSVTLGGRSVDYDESMVEDFGQWTVGGSSMQTYSKNSADFAAYFTLLDDQHIQCKQTQCVIQYDILAHYCLLSMDGQTLPIPGLPRSNEIYLPYGAESKQIVIQLFERAILCYDPLHLLDGQPGMQEVYFVHLDQVNPGTQQLFKLLGIETTPAPAPNLTDAIAMLQALGPDVATKVAQALKDLGA